MDFEILSEVTGIQVIATGRGIRELPRLNRIYGKGRLRKLKGFALVRLRGNRSARREEIHWYEARGIGKREFKIKYQP